MAEPRHPWPAPGVVDTPKGRLNRALLRDFFLLLPWLLLAVLAGALVGSWAGWAVFGAVVVVRAARFAATGTTGSLRRAGIRIVRLGSGAEPERWRLLAYHLAPVAVFGALVAVGGSAYVIAAVLAVYLALAVWVELRARRRGRDVDAMLALFGLDVACAGDPPPPPET